MSADDDLPVSLGNYLHTVPDEDDEIIRLVDSAPGYRLQTIEDGDVVTDRAVRFDHLFDGWYLAQAADDDEADYNLIHVRNGSSIDEWGPYCEQSETSLPGVSSTEDGDCVFDNYGSLRNAAYARASAIAGGDSGAGAFLGNYAAQ